MITTSAIDKFYSNGLDLEHANFYPGFFPDGLYAMWRRILTYPMPTIALMNGHAFAGAIMTAMMHDYRIMNPHKGFLCLNEVDLGIPLRAPMSSIFRQKLSAQTYRTMVLEGKRFKVRIIARIPYIACWMLTDKFQKALDAIKEGIVDSLGSLEEALKFIDEYKLQTKADKGVYGELKREMWRETLYYLENEREEKARVLEVTLSKAKEREAIDRRIEIWSKKAKL